MPPGKNRADRPFRGTARTSAEERGRILRGNRNNPANPGRNLGEDPSKGATTPKRNSIWTKGKGKNIKGAVSSKRAEAGARTGDQPRKKRGIYTLANMSTRKSTRSKTRVNGSNPPKKEKR